MDLIQVAQLFGLPVALAAYLLWRDARREIRDAARTEALTSRMQALEQDQRDRLADLVTVSTRAIERSSEIADRQTQVMDRFERALSRRPCLAAEQRQAS